MYTPKSAVIGLGNILRQDDGIGIVIIESLKKDHQRPGIDYLDFGIASFDLIMRLKDYRQVLLIDGISAGLNPGDLKIFTLNEALFSNVEGAISTHELNLKDIFELAKKFEVKTKIYVAGIQVKDVNFGQALSGELNQKKAQLVKQIDDFILGRLS